MRDRTSHSLAFVSYRFQHWHGPMVTSRWRTAILIESLGCRSRNNWFPNFGWGASSRLPLPVLKSRFGHLPAQLPRSYRVPGMAEHSDGGWIASSTHRFGLAEAVSIHVEMQMRRTHQRLCRSAWTDPGTCKNWGPVCLV